MDGAIAFVNSSDYALTGGLGFHCIYSEIVLGFGLIGSSRDSALDAGENV
jgi:hypothetical protein